MPAVGDQVILKASGLAGKVTKVSGEIVTVAAGFIVAEAKLNELEKSSSSTSSVKTSSTQTFAGVKKKPTSPSRAAREFDALLGNGKSNASSSDGSRRVSGEDYDDEFKGKQIYDYYSEDYKNREFGVLNSWEKELNKRGWYSEWYDAGTVMIWPQ